MKFRPIFICFLFGMATHITLAQMDASVLKDVEAIEGDVIDWRHHFHENPKN